MSKHCKIFIDMDGTLCGRTRWDGFIKNTLDLFLSGLLFKPPNVRWTLLTSRPKIDYPIIKLVCYKYKLNPEEIITTPSIFYPYKNKEEVARWKRDILVLEYMKNNSVIYVDDDPEILSMIDLKNEDMYLYNSSSFLAM